MTLIQSRSSPTDSPQEFATDTDAELLARSGQTPESFATLFDRHAGALHRYVARRLGGDLADDLVAQTFLVAFEQRSRYDPTRPDARPWLYGIATNLVRRHHRDEVRLLRALARMGAEPVAAPCPADGVARRVDAGVMSHQVAALLAGIPTKERDVLLLHAWADLDLDEIGRALDIPAGTVRSRLHRARKRLRSELDNGRDDITEETMRHG